METYKSHSFSEESYGNHEVKVSLQWAGYKGELICSFGGNTNGSSVLAGMAESFEMGDITVKVCEENRKYVLSYLDESFPHSEISGVRLFDKDGNTMEVTSYQMGHTIVGLEILEFTEEDITI